MSRPVVVYHPLPGIGDLMWHLPYIRAIAEHRADGKVVLLTRASTQAEVLLKAEQQISRIEYIPYLTGPVRHPRELISTLVKLKALRPRSLWILDKISRPAIAARLLGIREVFGFGLGAQSRWLIGETLSAKYTKAHPVEKLQAFFSANDIPVRSTEPELAVDTVAAAALAERFKNCPRPWVMLGVGAKNQARRWPHDAFRELIDRANRNGTSFVVGAPVEFDSVNAEIVTPARAAAVNVSDLRMAEIAAMASLCDLFVGNDSGPMNVAAAVGTPSIGLFGVTPSLDYSKFIYSVNSPVTDRCMSAITVSDVALAVNRVLVSDKQPCTSP